MRATALLPISLLACGSLQSVNVTAKLVMSNAPVDWCGSGNPDTIRMDCPFQMGIYFLDDSSPDAGPTVLNTTCVKLDGQANRAWKDLPQALDNAMVATHVDSNDMTQSFRLEMAIIEPPGTTSCDHDLSVTSPAFHGESASVMGADPTIKRIDVASKCLRAFTPTATCLP